MNDTTEAAAAVIRARNNGQPVEIALLLDAGLESALDTSGGAVDIPFSALPGFEKFGPRGRFTLAQVEGATILFMTGRSQYFETADSALLREPFEMLAQLGVHTVLVTGSVASVDADTPPGTLALVTDHINLTGSNPLLGSVSDGGSVSMTRAYDERLLRRIKLAAQSAGVPLREGVFLWLSGPTFETPAEARMARTLGADLIGMGIAPDVIVARRIGLRVIALGAVTHFGAGFLHGDPSHSETRAQARQASIPLRRIIRSFLRLKEDAWGAESKPTLRRPVS